MILSYFPQTSDHIIYKLFRGLKMSSISPAVFRTTVIKDDTRNENYRQSHLETWVQNSTIKLQQTKVTDSENSNSHN